MGDGHLRIHHSGSRIVLITDRELSVYTAVSLNVQGGKEPTCQCRDIRDAGLIPGLERSPREVCGNPLQYSCLENPIDKGAWWAIVHGSQRVGHNRVTKQTQMIKAWRLT